MPSFLLHPFIVYPTVFLLVATCTYLILPRLLMGVQNRALKQKDEVLRLLDLMFVETSEKQITRLLFAISLGPSFLLFLLLWPNVTVALPVCIALSIFMSTLPLTYVRAQAAKRQSLFVAQMVDGLTIMANGIKAGLSVTQSMERVVDSLPNPISQEFNLILSQIRLGRTVEEALLELGERVPKADVQMFVTAINILKETGGNMAETFSTIVTVIRERQKVERKIEAMTAQGLMQGMIVSFVPIGILVLLWVVDPTYVTPMFSTTLGIILLVIMFSLQIAGGVMTRKIVTIKV